MPTYFLERRRVTKALINGQIVDYDMCSENPNAYDGFVLVTYLGKGVIYSVNGKLQNSDRVVHFWKRK